MRSNEAMIEVYGDQSGLTNDLDDMVALLERHDVPFSTQRNPVAGMKGPAEVVTCIVVAASAMRAVKPFVLQLLAEWLNRPGDRRLMVRRTNAGGDVASLEIRGEGISPKQFSKLLKDLDTAIESLDDD